MRKSAIGFVVTGVAASLVLAACSSSSKSSIGGGGGGSSSSSGATGKVGVILPDETSSPRYIQYDKPLLEQAFKNAGIQADIQNAQGDKTKFATIADSMIQDGRRRTHHRRPGQPVRSRGATEGQGRRHQDHRLRPADPRRQRRLLRLVRQRRGRQAAGPGLVACLDKTGKANPAVAELNGSPDDNNATLFAQGYNSVLNPLYAAGKYKKAGNQSVPMWDKDKAVTIFQGMFTAAGGNIDGVLAANDTLGNAAITILKQNGKTCR